VAEQEGVIGRTRPDSVPFADATTHGLHVVSFGRDIDRFDRQLRSVYGLTDDGVVDHLMQFTRARTGSFWLCPSVEDLDAVAPLPEDDED
jgi:putative iron-dependent peroxidase